MIQSRIGGECGSEREPTAMWRFLSLTSLRAEFRVGRDCELPEYLGSALRGVLGHELRAVSCAEPEIPCSVCSRPDRCASGALFDAEVAGDRRQAGEDRSARADGGGGAGGFDRPRPYILDAPPGRRGTYPAGEAIRLGVTLVGRARVWSPGSSRPSPASAGAGSRSNGTRSPSPA